MSNQSAETDQPREACNCPPTQNGDVRCHVCGEFVNVRCWNCKTPRGEGRCPNPLDGGTR